MALYTCIPHNRAIMACSYHLRKYSNYSLDLREYIFMVTTFLLSHNFFCSMVTFINRYVALRWACSSPFFGQPLYELVRGESSIYDRQSIHWLPGTVVIETNSSEYGKQTTLNWFILWNILIPIRTTLLLAIDHNKISGFSAGCCCIALLSPC